VRAAVAVVASPITYTTSRTVTAANHEGKVEYHEHTEVAVARLTLSP
jgi:hypothetical protein